MRRQYARATMQQIENYTSGKQGYEAGMHNRLNPFSLGVGMNENAVPREQIDRLRQQSWKLYRDNTAARKIIRSLESKVVGRFPKPQSQATMRNGEPHLEFRRRAAQLWKAVYREIDYRGRPGQGGQHLVDIHKTALRATILGGEVLPRFRYLRRSEQRRKGLTIPRKLQLIHAERLDDSLISDNIFYGIEFDDEEQRQAYHILNAHPSDPRINARRGSSVRVPARS
jgi:capsid protein